LRCERGASLRLLDMGLRARVEVVRLFLGVAQHRLELLTEAGVRRLADLLESRLRAFEFCGYARGLCLGALRLAPCLTHLVFELPEVRRHCIAVVAAHGNGE